MASIWKLPVIYLCENNQYAMSMPVKKAFSIEQISTRAVSYNIPGLTVDGNDPLAVYVAVRDAADRARRGEGPALIESRTYRYKGHSRSDRQAYRTRDEVNDWMENRDAIQRFSTLLVTAGVVSEQESQKMRDTALSIIDQAVEFSENSPLPEVSTLLEGVYA
jgi:TPP-dependent pyruvate/acetoin dehydrogenase alpha subunit